MSVKVLLRAATQMDVEFIFSSWLKSYRNTPQSSLLTNPTYFTEQHRLIEKLLRVSQVLVASSSEDSSQILGWACASDVENCFCLHYVYVKHTFRKLGIARMLINAFKEANSPGVYTHHTKVMPFIAPKFNLLYHPYILINNYIQFIPDETLVTEVYNDSEAIDNDDNEELNNSPAVERD